MTETEVANMVAEIGVPYTYYDFPDDTARELPLVAFFYTDNNDFIADDINYTEQRTLAIELYTREKDFALEQTVRNVLNEHNLPFSQEAEFLDDERCWITVYTTEVFIDG